MVGSPTDSHCPLGEGRSHRPVLPDEGSQEWKCVSRQRSGPVVTKRLPDVSVPLVSEGRRRCREDGWGGGVVQGVFLHE